MKESQNCRNYGVIEAVLISLNAFGKQNRVQAKILAKAAGYKDIRTMRMEIQSERKAGANIRTTSKNGGGYWIDDFNDPEQAYLDATECSRYFFKLAFKFLETARTIRLPPNPYQCEIHEVFPELELPPRNNLKVGGGRDDE